MSTFHFTLYSRSYCHLCEDMHQALLALLASQAPDDSAAGWFTVALVDVDADPELVARYDELVPVLAGSRDGQTPVQLCHYFLDAEAIKGFLSGGG